MSQNLKIKELINPSLEFSINDKVLRNYHSTEQIQNIGKYLLGLITSYYNRPEESNVFKPLDTQILKDKFSKLKPPEDGIGLDAALETFNTEILPHSINTWHPFFLNQHSAGASFPVIIGKMLSAMLNPTLSTNEAAPVASIIEKNLVRWMAQILGMSENTTGIFLPGGSLANLFGLTLARDSVFRDNKRINSESLVFICSEAAHYSIEKTIRILGLGKNQLFSVKVNSREEMLVDDLLRVIAICNNNQSNIGAIVATLGLTKTGGFDPLAEIADICQKNKLHLHVDASFGGGAALSSNKNQLFRGIEQADTVVWDAHKWFHTPLSCSVLLAKDPKTLNKSFGIPADYLFHRSVKDWEEDDLGQHTFLCGKEFHALPLWLIWTTYGTAYFRQLAQERMKLVDQINIWFKTNTDFLPAYSAVSPIICFRFHCAKQAAKLKDKYSEYSNHLHERLRQKIIEEGKALINITSFGNFRFLRLIFVNQLFDFDHFKHLMDRIRLIANDLNRH